MDRILGANNVDIGGGRRGFRDENLAAGVAGTNVEDIWLNGIQEELMAVIEAAGLVGSTADNTLLLKALGLRSSKRNVWSVILSMTLSSAPGAPTVGDLYLVPTGATGIWAANVGKLAEWSGSAWTYTTPIDGHGVSLPDGRVFERVAGVYVEKLAVDGQSGKWSYAAAAGTANALTASCAPVISAYTVGMMLRVKIATTNTGPATLDAGAGALPIQTLKGAALAAGDLPAGAIVGFICTGTAWMMIGQAYSESLKPLPLGTTLFVRSDGNDGNNGSANTAAAAFQTIQGAMNYVLANYAISGSPITIQLGIAGTYAPPVLFQGSAITIIGDPAAPQNYIIAGTSGSVISVQNSYLQLNGVTVRQSVAGGHYLDAVVGGVVDLSNVRFSNSGAITGGSCVRAAYGSSVRLQGTITFAGNAGNALSATGGGAINAVIGTTLAFSGTPSFSNATIQSADVGAVIIQSVTFTGSALGVRYSALGNGVIDTNGAGASYIPGGTAGSTTTGGQYV